MQPLIWGYKSMREIARRMPQFRGEPPALHPAFAPGGPASTVAHAEGPVVFDAPRIVYSDDDERAIETFVRANGTLLLLSPPSRPPSYHDSFTSFLFLCWGAVATCFHSVSPSFLYAVRHAVKRVLVACIFMLVIAH